MSLQKKFGHTVTLKELCKILKISRGTYYNYLIKKERTIKKEEIYWIPDPIPNFNKKLFYTIEVEKFLQLNTR